MRLTAAFVCAVESIWLGGAPGHAEKPITLVIKNGTNPDVAQFANSAIDDVAAALPPHQV